MSKENLKTNLFFKIDEKIDLELKITEADLKVFNKSIDYLNKKKWTEALSWAASIKSENLKDAMVNYTLWKKYSQIKQDTAEDDFSDLLDFIQTHQYLPSIKSIQERAEKIYLSKNISYYFMEKYFEKIKPINPKTVIKNLTILHEKEKNDITRSLISKIRNDFSKYNYNNEEIDTFIYHFRKYLTEDDFIDKIEELIWNKEYNKANNLMNYVSKDKKLFYENIIKIQEKAKNSENILESIPSKFNKNELVQYIKLSDFYKKKNQGEALKILFNLDNKKIKKKLKWWTYQNYFTRELLKNNDYENAYKLISNLNLREEQSEYAESEWLAGWIMLEFLNNPQKAYKHFHNMYLAVNYPISVSRATYWLGRASQASNDKNKAIEWYEKASKYSLYFYGQLAFHERNELLDVSSLSQEYTLPEPPKITEEEKDKALENEIVRLAYLMAATNSNRIEYTNLFKKTIKDAPTSGEKAAIFEIIKSTEDEKLITDMAKYLTYHNVYYINNLFPVLIIINLENPNSHLVHAMIKQESGFFISAESKVGAVGFMQLMPYTAKEMAKKMKVKYSKKALVEDPAYNVFLGFNYINSLIKDFGGSHVLAIASYNAGTSPVRKWIRDYNDPRNMKNIRDTVKWIESIPYNETRNYVQRVIENSVIYEYILEKNIKKYDIQNVKK